MKLSKSSMLYRSAKFQHEVFRNRHYYAADDLCTFVRNYLFNMIKNIVFGSVFGTFILSTISTGIFFCMNHFNLEWMPVGGLTALFFTLGVVVWFFTGLILVFFAIVGSVLGIIWCVRKLLGFEKYDEDGNHIPGVLETYMHSRKHKYCANLEIVD